MSSEHDDDPAAEVAPEVAAAADDVATADAWLPLDLAVARAALEFGSVADVPAAAAAALEAGADGSQLRVLAGMAGATASELDARIGAVYREERGELRRPAGGAAARLVATDLVQRGARGEEPGEELIRALARLWERSGYDDGDLSDLGIYDEHLDLAREGALRHGPEAVVAEFADTCRQILAAGGPTIRVWQPSAL